jgi:hypothetical protein
MTRRRGWVSRVAGTDCDSGTWAEGITAFCAVPEAKDLGGLAAGDRRHWGVVRRRCTTAARHTQRLLKTLRRARWSYLEALSSADEGNRGRKAGQAPGACKPGEAAWHATKTARAEGAETGGGLDDGIATGNGQVERVQGERRPSVSDCRGRSLGRAEGRPGWGWL